MSTALYGIDIIGKTKDILLVAFILLQGYFKFHPVFLRRDKYWFRVKRLLVLIEVFNEADDSAIVLEIMDSFCTLVVEDNSYSTIQKSKFAKACG